VPLEKRTRVEIFLPIRLETTNYRTLIEWLAEELAFSRGGSTLTTPFAGLYFSTTEKTLTRDQVHILFAILILIQMSRRIARSYQLI
jgi:membrane carboxypeptidase/penicillin-binding protein